MAKSSMNKSADYERYYQELGNNPGTKLFDTMKDVFMFAVALGFHRGERLPFQQRGGEPIAIEYFKDEDRVVMDLIALSSTNDISILLNDDSCVERKYKLIEEYANAGMREMVDAFCKPIVDESSLKRFIESFDPGTGQRPKADIAELLRRASVSIN